MVQLLGLSLALVGDHLILTLNLSDDAVQVKVPVVVHGQDDVGVGDILLQLGQFLQYTDDWPSSSVRGHGE